MVSYGGLERLSGYNRRCPNARRTVGIMSGVTQILERIEAGDGQAAEQLLPLVYDELRKLAAARMAQEAPGQTLQATALVHEAYLRLVDTDKAQHWDSRGHFFAAAAEAMRRILVDRARRKRSRRHGGGFERLDLLERDLAVEAPDDSILRLDAALTELAKVRPQAAQLVNLRFFAGLTMDQTASVVGVSSRTARRLWVYAQAWLRREIESRPEG
jgi:RNA polymerase sigma factor (TIGR02999 family)